nr:hypothetical protein [Tanacetum cinerariifolium]
MENYSEWEHQEEHMKDSKGGIIILPPVSFEEHVAVQRETKARTLFGGNEESKKMRKTMHEAENKTKEGEQVYGLMDGIKSDFVDHAGNAAGSVYDTAAEFAMIGISSK